MNGTVLCKIETIGNGWASLTHFPSLSLWQVRMFRGSADESTSHQTWLAAYQAFMAASAVVTAGTCEYIAPASGG